MLCRLSYLRGSLSLSAISVHMHAIFFFEQTKKNDIICSYTYGFIYDHRKRHTSLSEVSVHMNEGDEGDMWFCRCDRVARVPVSVHMYDFHFKDLWFLFTIVVLGASLSRVKCSH